MTQVAAPDLQTAQQQFQEQQEYERTRMPQYTNEVFVVPCRNEKDRKFGVAALLTYMPFLGIFGAHHFYLRRTFIGTVYACTLGLAGIGWVVDWFRLGRLLRRCNEDTSEARAKGHWVNSYKYPGHLTERTFSDAFLLWLPPSGLFGLYHFYLGRKRYGKFHAWSLGFFGFGWFIDLFRLFYMVQKANTDAMLMKKGTVVGVDPIKNSDAYMTAVPFGIFGLHHLYLGNKSRAIMYLCSLGLLGIGWVTDLIQMAFLVKEANKKHEMNERLQNALRQEASPTSNVIMLTTIAAPPGGMTNAGFAGGPGNHGQQNVASAGAVVALPEPPPAYRETAGVGETVLHEGGTPGGPLPAQSASVAIPMTQ